MFQKKLIIMYGPTGVGKTEFAEKLAHIVKGEIINADVGQFYKPLSIGTAKPPWQKSILKQHFFDILYEPCDLTVLQYRERLMPLLDEIWNRESIPIIVGGSGFYITSLLFPPQQQCTIQNNTNQFEEYDTQALWLKLKMIDPERAEEIHRHDRYRIERALQIWQTTGIKPSGYRPVFDPPAPFLLLSLTRDRDDLYRRINKRVKIMLNEGWIDEVQKLLGTSWEEFLKNKKIIGYNDIISYLYSTKTSTEYIQLCEIIAKKTRNYAKRQMTFWRMLEKKLTPYVAESPTTLCTINLTTNDSQVYIKELLHNEFFKFDKK